MLTEQKAAPCTPNLFSLFPGFQVQHDLCYHPAVSSYVFDVIIAVGITIYLLPYSHLTAAQPVPAWSQIRSLAINWLPEYQLLPHRNITISITVGLVLPGRRGLSSPQCAVLLFSSPVWFFSSCRGVLMQGRMEVSAGLAGEWAARCKLEGNVVPSHQGLPLYLHTQLCFRAFSGLFGEKNGFPFKILYPLTPEPNLKPNPYLNPKPNP